MSWDFSNPIPVHLRDETPFNCPSCNHEICVQDEHFNDYVVEIMYLD